MLNGLPLIEKSDSLCEGCALGKRHRETFLEGTSIRAKALLDIVYSYLCGPMKHHQLVATTISLHS